MTKPTILIAVAAVLSVGVLRAASPYLVVDTSAFATADVAAELQKIIDANPHRTIFLPDGVYFWYSAKSGKEVGFSCEGRFDSRVRDTRVTFRADSPKAVNRVLEVGEPGGFGAMNGIVFPAGTTDDRTHEAYAGR